MHQGFLLRQNLQSLIDCLHQQGYSCLGPVADQQAIRLQPITSVTQLPEGVEVDQHPGQYHLKQATHSRHFSWANLPQSLKPLTFAPHENLWRCTRNAAGELSFSMVPPKIEALAVIGVRACDLAGLKLQQQHFMHGTQPDPWFGQRLDALFIVAVHCSHPASTCFCTATGDGPAATYGFDLALHELDDGFIVESGSERGETLARQIPLQTIQPDQIRASRQQLEVAASQPRRLPDNVARKLHQQLTHEHWQEIGERCLACGNCTAVCPSCFCHQQHEHVDVVNNQSVHDREWSSCFTHAHGYLAGFQIRATPALRYRQWLTHKFSGWIDQYGRIGCTGCGRCITWCPVGIDVTAELQTLCVPS